MAVVILEEDMVDLVDLPVDMVDLPVDMAVVSEEALAVALEEE